MFCFLYKLGIFDVLADCVIEYEKNPVAHAVSQVYDIVDSDRTDSYTNKLRHAVQTVEECLNRYK